MCLHNFREGAQVSEMDLNDEPPIYEPPPSYEEVMKKEKEKILRQCGGQFVCLNGSTQNKLPDSPPPPYRDGATSVEDVLNAWAPFSDNLDGAGPSSDPSPPLKPVESVDLLPSDSRRPFNIMNFFRLGPDCDCAGACSCARVRRGSLSATWSPATSRLGVLDNLLQSMHSNHPSPPNTKVYNVKGSMSADNIFHSGST